MYAINIYMVKYLSQVKNMNWNQKKCSLLNGCFSLEFKFTNPLRKSQYIFYCFKFDVAHPYLMSTMPTLSDMKHFNRSRC